MIALQIFSLFMILFLVVLVIIIYIKRIEIWSFLYPELYVAIEMLELDNNVSSWIQRKNSDLRFEFNKGYYNLFHQSLDSSGKYVIVPNIYREGRLAKMYYHEGNSDPIDYRLGTISGNPQISKQLETIQISKLFEDDKNTAQEFFQKYGLYIVIGVIILVVYMLISRGGS